MRLTKVAASKNTLDNHPWVERYVRRFKPYRVYGTHFKRFFYVIHSQNLRQLNLL